MYILNNTTCTLYLLTNQTTDEEQMINTIIVALIDVLAVACMIGTLLSVPTDEKH